MPDTAENIVDLTILHQIGLLRFSRTVIRKILSTLRRMQADVEAQIRERMPTGENGEPDPQSLRLGALLAQVRATQEEAHRAIRGQFDAELGEAIATEAAFAARLSKVQIGLDANLATVSAEQLRAAVMSRPMQGKSLRDWTLKLEAGDIDRVRQQIVLGYLEGESILQVVKRVRAVSTVTARGAETLTRTTMTHINARAVVESAKANPGLFPGYQWVSVLDNRTCFQAGTLVETPTGLVAIESLAAGDLVIGGSGRTQVVQGARKARSRDMVRVTLSNGETAVCTADHLWRIKSGRWVEAGQLEVGEKLASVL